MSDAIPFAVAVGLAATAAITDWRSGRIPNWLTLPPLMVAPAAYLILLGVEGLVFSLLGAFACGAAPYLLFRRGALGGGDVKLLTAIGALVGVMVGLEGQLLGFVIAACYAIALRAFGGGLNEPRRATASRRRPGRRSAISKLSATPRSWPSGTGIRGWGRVRSATNCAARTSR